MNRVLAIVMILATIPQAGAFEPYEESKVVSLFEQVCIKGELTLEGASARASKLDFRQIEDDKNSKADQVALNKWRYLNDDNKDHILLSFSLKERDDSFVSMCGMATMVNNVKVLANLLANVPKVHLNKIEGARYNYSHRSEGGKKRFIFMSWEENSMPYFTNMAVVENAQ